jgi:outer membrane protein assembly factor BamB
MWRLAGGWRLPGAMAALAVLAVTASLLTSASAATVSGWPAYLNGSRHSSYNANETAITPAKAPSLVEKWRFVGGKATKPGQPSPGYQASPTVADGAVFIGSATGWFYKLNRLTGAVLHKVFIGYQPTKTCFRSGIVDTATVATDPRSDRRIVYVGGPNGYLYALRASNLSVKWKSVIAIPAARKSDYFEWSSPTVSGGRIYIGVSSHCDNPLVRAGVIGYNQSTGKRFAHFYSVPRHRIGGSVWSSVAVAPGGDVYASTGNGPSSAQRLSYSESIIKLSPRTLKPLGRFQVPRSQAVDDGDFGASPTLFDHYVGACNKNGVFYAVNRSTMTLAWKRRIASDPGQCLAAAIFSGDYLYFGGPATTIGGKTFPGSVQERNPADGKLLWATRLPDRVLGSPSMDGGGVIAVGTQGHGKTPNAIYLLNAATGKIVRTLIKGSADFAQSVFAESWLFTANGTGVYAWGP